MVAFTPFVTSAAGTPPADAAGASLPQAASVPPTRRAAIFARCLESIVFLVSNAPVVIAAARRPRIQIARTLLCSTAIPRAETIGVTSRRIRQGVCQSRRGRNRFRLLL
jgi:hypothetical protein